MELFESYETTAEIDNVVVGPQTIVKGAIVTDSKSTTLTSLIKGTTTNPTFGTLSDNRFFWSRRGENLIVRGGLLQTTAGTAGAGNYVIDLPNGLQIDGFKTTSSNSGGMGTVGSILIWDGATYYTGVITADASANQLNVWFGDELLSPNRWSTSNVPFSSTNLRISFSAEVPIKGWSSNVILSEDAGNREIVCNVYQFFTQSIPEAATKIAFTSAIGIDNDTTSSWDTTNHRFNVPESGFYSIKGRVSFASSTGTERNIGAYIYVNNSGIANTLTRALNGNTASVEVNEPSYYLNKGDYVELFAYQNDVAATSNLNATAGFLSIAKRSSPQTISALSTKMAFITGPGQ